MSPRLDRALSVIVTVAAVAVAATVVRRELFAPPRASGGAARPVEPVYLEDWQAMLPDGIELGKPGAAIQIVEFADLECPYCAQFHREVLAALLADAVDASITFIHHPLRMHRFAKPAAQAAECAHQQGRFLAYVDRIYASQDSLGLKSWWAFARESAVKDSLRFASCLDGPQQSRIEAGTRWAERHDITATPTVLVNGWALPRPPTTEQLQRIVARINRGERPF